MTFRLHAVIIVKEHPVLTNCEAGWASERRWRLRRNENCRASAGNWNTDPRSYNRSQLALLTKQTDLRNNESSSWNCVYRAFCMHLQCITNKCRSQWPRGLRSGSAAARLLGLWVQIPPGAWMSVSCECCVLSGRGLCDRLITRPEESYRLWFVVVCDLETSWMRRPWPTGGLLRQEKKNQQMHNIFNT